MLVVLDNRWTKCDVFMTVSFAVERDADVVGLGASGKTKKLCLVFEHRRSYLSRELALEARSNVLQGLPRNILAPEIRHAFEAKVEKGLELGKARCNGLPVLRPPVCRDDIQHAVPGRNPRGLIVPWSPLYIF